MKKSLIVIIVIIVIVVISAGAYILLNGKTPPPTPTDLKITDPTNNQFVSQFYTVRGNYTPKSGEIIEVLIRPEGYTWWVQENPTITSNSTWEARVQVGEQGDRGKSFRILAIVTTEDLPTGEYGLEPPQDYRIKDEVIVTRQ